MCIRDSVVVEKYKNIVLFFIKRRWLTWSLLVCSIILLAFLMNTTKTSLVPDEDQGVVFVNVSTAAGSSLKTTDDVITRIEKRLEAIPQVKHVQKVAGYGLLSGQGSSFGMLILKPVSYTHLRAHETRHDLVCRLLLEKKKNNNKTKEVKE